MKTIVLFALSLLSFSGFSQDSLRIDILHSLDSLIGERVGDGLCGRVGLELERIHGFTYSKVVKKVKKVKPGDYIEFRRVRWVDRVGTKGTAMDHVAVVYKVISRGRFFIVDQNSDGAKQTETKVDLYEFDMSWVTSGTLTFYSPVVLKKK